MSKLIRVILADDHALVLEGLRSLLAAEPDMTVIATATDGERLLEAVERFHPDIVVSDIRMPYLDGINSLPHIRRISSSVKVLFLTAYADDETLQAALSSGVDGLLYKTDPPQQTIRAIRQIIAGQMIFPAAARRWLTSSESQKPQIILSQRKNEVLALIAEGMSNAQVAQQLQISVSTVKFHLQNIYQTLGVSNRTEATHWYLKNSK
jgi:DNA-binding NarL/FixJ family response regulator